MFSGIVEETGKIEEVISNGAMLSFRIENKTLFASEAPGCSIAVNGVCLTQSAWEPGISTFDVVQETLNKTNLGLLKKGDLVNLERSLKADSRIEGHFVQGHVDGVGKIYQIDQELCEYWIELPEKIAQYLIEKGSIALDGVSLTIAELQESKIRIALVPHTLEITNLKTKQVGDSVNLEVDLFAKYTFNYLEKCNSQRALNS